MKLRIGSPADLARYVALQLDRFYPDGGADSDLEKVMLAMPASLQRMRPILANVRAFVPETLDHFNSLQYTTLLYLLGNELWRCGTTDGMADRLFCLNRSLNCIDLFPAVAMPEVFFISHGLGSVLGNVSYGDGLVVFQHVTVGRVGENKPVIGKNVVLYPGATVTGRSVIGNNSVVSAGTVVNNQVVPDDSVVGTRGNEVVTTPRKKDYSGLYLRQRP